MLVFNTLEYTEKMKSVGFTDDQVKVQAEGLANILENNLATKKDIEDPKTAMEIIKSVLLI
jgi:hypothetical protein